MSKHTYNNIGSKLYLLRIEQGLTQNDVAERCNMSVNYYGRIEREECNCSVNLLGEILKALGKEIVFK
ncbi:helix-turn-helix transcriptional regulator [Phascolarctobacterium sp.]|uniref:helix-turn-helix domain-containing protein n=1 Tax=Phascolarctobacterium sp. TaxID=2049039 RepID=UPI0015ADFD94|nr:helix-turn-helix transcriptional regulator [uncultured Phascolarctobacterium sp.]